MKSSERAGGLQAAGSIVLGVVAVTLPALLPLSTVPSVTFFNQIVAIVGWGLWLAWNRSSDAPAPRMDSGVAMALVALALMALATALATADVPWGLRLSALAFLGVAGWTMLAAQRATAAQAWFDAFCIAAALAGLLSVVIALVQHICPGWESPLVATASRSGRVGANLRQPNHLSSLLLISLVSALVLARRIENRCWGQAVQWLMAVVFTLGIALTASRTGILCLLLLAGWGMLDRRLPATTRNTLVLLPVVYALWWFALNAGGQGHDTTFAGTRQLNAADISSSRFAIWANTLELIRQNPWTGVGWGEFNFAWTLTPFPDRPVAFFDHTHNLPLQLWVELGLPLGTVVLVLLAWALWLAFDRTRRATGAEAPLRAAAFVMVLMMGVHSLLEYPLWYAYFLLPTAFAWGLCLAPLDEPVTPATPVASRLPWLRLGGVLMAAGALFSVFDYHRIVRIFVPPANAAPLAERIADGQKSVFFDHHAHYAAATTAPRPSDAMPSFKVATHFLLDTRLMMAWARALNEAGEVDKARHVAARLKEFRNPGAASFFAECEQPRAPDEKPPFQCEAPQRSYTFRDFR